MRSLICKSQFVLLVGGWLFAAAEPPALAHGDVHELIQKVTEEIAKAPRSPQLYLRRAELQRSHEAWDAALADLERAETLTNHWHFLHFARARLFLDAGWFESAKVAADRFLEREPNYAQALTVRARARVKLGERLAAAEDYARAITNSTSPAPDLFVERTQALVAEGDAHFDAALACLEQGIGKLGPLVVLQSAAMDVELKQKRVDAALARLDKVMAQFPRKETWLMRRGEILQEAGRGGEAVEAFKGALQAMETLPPARRAVTAMAELEQRIRAALAKANQPVK